MSSPRAALLLLGALAACAGGPDGQGDSGEDDTGAPTTEEGLATLTARGPWNVGYAQSEVTYDDPVDDAPRTLRLATWYPTDDTSGFDAAAGLYLSSTAWTDATHAAGPWPLAVFSHGHQGYAENSSFLMEHLASHGWVVAAPDHTGNTTFDGGDRSTSIYLQRPGDISAVIDAVRADAADDVDDDAVLLLGHSFGGYTTFPLAGGTYDVDGIVATCAGGEGGPECTDLDPEDEALLRDGLQDDRIGAAVAMAPGDSDLFGADGLTTIDVPMLHMTATEDQPDGSQADTIWAQLQGDAARRVVLLGGGHQSFTDFADVLEDVPLDREEGFRVVDAYVLAWAWALRGDERGRAFLDGEAAVSDDADLRR